MYDVEGCLQLNGIKGIEVHMTSNNPLSVVFTTDSNGNSFWKGVAVNPVSTGNYIYIRFTRV